MECPEASFCPHPGCKDQSWSLNTKRATFRRKKQCRSPPAVNYSPLCKPRENRPLGFPATDGKSRICLCISDKIWGTETAQMYVSGIKTPAGADEDVYLCCECAPVSHLGRAGLCSAPSGPAASQPCLLMCVPVILQDCATAAVCLSIHVNHRWIFWVASSSLQQRLTLAAHAIAGRKRLGEQAVSWKSLSVP